ncbi:MAG TPA: hypothetical protein VK008_06030 [Sphingobacteriaceae bacterium]|nr:hypothetical protein [Sphingobacteriaceae bacterium]
MGAALLAIVLSSCSVRALPDLESALNNSGTVTVDAATTTVEPLALRETPALSLEPLWQETFPGAVRAALAQNGQSFLVFGEKGSQQWGFDVYADPGRHRWQFTFPQDDIQKVDAGTYGLDRRIIAMVQRKNQQSRAYVFDGAGKALWTRDLEGDVLAAMADDASRAAFINRQTGAVLLTDGSGRTLATLQLGAGASGSFVPGSQWLLLTDQRRVQVVGADGRVMQEEEIPDPIPWRVALSQKADRIAITTGRPDSAVYMYNKGELQWRHLLFPGGRNEPVLSPGGDTLYVVDVGDQAGVHAYAVDSGAVNWRLYFAAPPGYRPSIRALKAWPQQPLLLHYVETPVNGNSGSAGSWHALVWLSRDGRVLGHLPLGSVGHLALSRDGSRAVISAPSSDDAQRPTATTVRFYNLQGLISSLSSN